MALTERIVNATRPVALDDLGHAGEGFHATINVEAIVKAIGLMLEKKVKPQE